MAITIYIDYSSFKRFSNVADKVSAKLLSSFLEHEVLVVVTDRFDFEFSIKAAYRKRRTENSAHIREIEIDNEMSTVISGIPTIKRTWRNYGEISFPKNREKHCHTF